MKSTFLFLIVFLPGAPVHGQPGENSFQEIDHFVRQIGGYTPDSLAYKLTAPFNSELEKARAIFSWISQNIAYNTGIYTSFKKQFDPRYLFDPLDTMSVWKTGDEMMAIRVLHRRVTVCEGYSKLFRVLCQYAGLESVIIIGYAKGHPSRPGKFRSNHAWNAVRIDSVWHLVDPTWGSGYVDYKGEFVQQTNDEYFMANPEQFIQDHYPEDTRWTLLSPAPPVTLFRQSPFRYKCFDKYSIDQETLGAGLVHARPGDTVKITLRVRTPDRDRKISQDPFFDSTILKNSPHSVFIQPKAQDQQMTYTYVVNNNYVQWLHLFYNEDLVLRYRLVLIL